MSEAEPSSPNPEVDQRVELVTAAREGDAAAKDELLELLAPQLYQWLDRQMGPRLKRFLSVADVAQESLGRVLSSLDRLRIGAGLGDVRGLLYQHARWTVLSRGRNAGQYRGESVVEGASPRAEPGIVAERSTGTVTLADEVRRMNEALDEMESDQAELVRAHLEGIPVPQLAKDQGITESAIRKRFQRALEELKRLLGSGGK